MLLCPMLLSVFDVHGISWTLSPGEVGMIIVPSDRKFRQFQSSLNPKQESWALSSCCQKPDPKLSPPHLRGGSTKTNNSHQLCHLASMFPQQSHSVPRPLLPHPHREAQNEQLSQASLFSQHLVWSCFLTEHLLILQVRLNQTSLVKPSPIPGAVCYNALTCLLTHLCPSVHRE